MTRSFYYDCHYDPDILAVRVSTGGLAEPQDIHTLYQQALDAGREANCYKLLLDVRELALDYDSGKVFQVLRDISPILQQLQVARLVTLSEFKHDLIEEYAKEQGFNLKNFTEQHQALEWLNAAG
ncbi:hypothetical protein GCM10009092_28460 [Bowmanella denitrificans]|uniref:STAS/SEC14 domain-containing protein n=1 Tax=Bowmanella denitrificans TaxID=366582 RepID=A0ABP3H729_9ALTE|nr:hypothetical protein [Bowmanella denitrificans]